MNKGSGILIISRKIKFIIITICMAIFMIAFDIMWSCNKFKYSILAGVAIVIYVAILYFFFIKRNNV